MSPRSAVSTSSNMIWQSILWCYDPARGNDKIYVVEVWECGGGVQTIALWGRRGAKYQRKVYYEGFSADHAIQVARDQALKKEFDKNYIEVVRPDTPIDKLPEPPELGESARDYAIRTGVAKKLGLA